MFEMVVHSYKVNLYGDDVDIETGWCGRRVRIYGRLAKMQGDIPQAPCSVTVTPEGVTIDDDSGGELVIQLSNIRISGIGGEE